MRGTLGLALLLSAGCASGVVGDWVPRALVSEAGESVASGALEVDRDGELLLRLTAAGDGPVGELSARGLAEPEGSTLRFAVPGDWRGEGAEARVVVGGDCLADGPELSCALDVDGQAWDAWFEREPPLD